MKHFLARFMIEFGLLSSVFDMLTFAGLVFVFHAGEGLFRTAWFVESLLTELLVALVVRTRRRFYASRPGRILLWTSVVLVVVAFAIPFLPLAGWLGFVPLPLLPSVAVIVTAGLYIVAAEALKKRFYRDG